MAADRREPEVQVRTHSLLPKEMQVTSTHFPVHEIKLSCGAKEHGEEKLCTMNNNKALSLKKFGLSW